MNSPRRPRPVSGTLNKPGSVLAGLRQEAERLRQQEKALMQVLPQALQGHCRLARVSRDAVVLVTDSSAWGSQLRFLGPTLCEALKESLGYRPQRLRVRVASPPPAQPEATPRRLSEQAGNHLEAAARSQTDPALKEALLRLSKRR